MGKGRDKRKRAKRKRIIGVSHHKDEAFSILDEMDRRSRGEKKERG